MGKKKKNKWHPRGGKNKKRGYGKPRPHYRGQTLPELLGPLPNRGVGRLIVRGSFKQNLEEPSYMRILEVDWQSRCKHKKKGKTMVPVTVERVFRGVIFPRNVNIRSTSYLPDFILVPKADEEKFKRNTKTATEKGYVYWNAEQKARIREMVKQGLTITEAKEREKVRYFGELAAAAAENATENKSMDFIKDVTFQDGPDDCYDIEDDDNNEENDGDDNGDDDADMDDDDNGDDDNGDDNSGYEIDKSDNCEEGAQANDVNTNTQQTQQQNIAFNQVLTPPAQAKSCINNFDNFNAEQKQRVENMIKKGMEPETAKQMELERQLAFEKAGVSK